MNKKIKANGLNKNGVFKNVSFELENERLCVLSKKAERSSALLDALAGVRLPDEGEHKGSVAYIAKGAPLPEMLTANEYLRFAMQVNKKDEIPEFSAELTEEFKDVSVHRLSGIQRLTLAVAASLINEPDAIAIEEPYCGLSFEEYGDLRYLIDSLTEHVSVIYTSSSVFECKESSDKTLVLSTGNQIYFGDTGALFETEINETDICCLIKGDKDAILSALERFEPLVEETVREGIYCVYVKHVPMFRAAETRGRIKKQLSKAKLSLLDISSEKEALVNIIGEMTEADKKRRAERERIKLEIITGKPEKISDSLVAFSHDEDGEYDDDGEESEDLDESLENEEDPE